MDAYLDIAVEVLEAERRPLSPRAILETAYRRSIVPPHLHGVTQHKTLQARISEDIVQRRDHSVFYRTQPGRFFLRKFLSDESVPEEFRVVFPARRRIRELVRGPALAVDQRLLETIAPRNKPVPPKKILRALKWDRLDYVDPRKKRDDLVFLRSFVCVSRDCDVLSYRVGRYRDDRDSFMSKRSIGFSTFVSVEDRTLFNFESFGILDAGIRAASIDLDIPPDFAPTERRGARLVFFVWPALSQSSTDLLAVVDYECPKWFEPTKRRLALNDLCWLDTSNPVNNIDDFDPWSRLILLTRYMSRPAGDIGFVNRSGAEFGHRRVSKVSN